VRFAPLALILKDLPVVFVLPLAQRLALTGSTIALISSCAAELKLRQRQIVSTSLTQPLLHGVNYSMSRPHSSVKQLVFPSRKQDEVLKAVVRLVKVDVMDFIARWNWAVCLLPSPRRAIA